MKRLAVLAMLIASPAMAQQQTVPIQQALGEKLMREVGYPRLAQHVQEHTYVKRWFRSLGPQWESEGDSTEMIGVLLGFLDLWLNTHIRYSDRFIGDFIRR